jgi:hypothetical protein
MASLSKPLLFFIPSSIHQLPSPLHSAAHLSQISAACSAE